MAGYSVFGIYTSRQGIEEAVRGLRDADFRGSDKTILHNTGAEEVSSAGESRVA